MRARMVRVLRDRAGVAMITVLLIGAGLTVVTSTAAFVTIEEFRAGNDDRRALAALAYAEAGIDRMLSHIKSGLVTYDDLNSAGCSEAALELPIGNVGVGTYRVSLTVWDPGATDPANRFPIPPSSGACANRPTSPHPGQGGDQTFFAITSVGRHPQATRNIRQIIALEPVGLPIGIYASAVDINSAKHEFQTVSMVSETTITNRKSISFIGDDPYYFIGDFFPGATGRDITEHVPAAAHAAGAGLFLKQGRDAEFETATKNCSANGTDGGAVAHQSLWDSDGSTGSGPITSGCTGQVGYPSTSKFTTEQLASFATPELSEQDHQTLKEAAQRFGVYCTFQGASGTGGTSCIQQGTDKGTAGTYDTYIADTLASGTNNFVAYFEFRSGGATQNAIDKIFSVWACNPDPDLSKSIVVIVRNGGVNWTGGGGNQINGAVIVDGDFSATGGFTFNGTLIVGGVLRITSSSQHFGLDDCWVSNMPGPFFRAVPTAWSEIDR